jgi:hypothetical protein
MLKPLDQTISTVLDTGWAPNGPLKPGFYFTVPDEDWRAKVKQTPTDLRLNVYLYEVRENTAFRRTEWDMIALPGPPPPTVVPSHPPVYFDCHYLISAWSGAEDSDAISPVLDEHEMLSEALRVLLRNPDVVPGTLPNALTIGGGPVFQQAHIYLTVAPPEAPRVLNDFWSTMRLPWRPAIQLVATAPLDLLQDAPPATLVTTFIQHYGLTLDGANLAGLAEEFIQIGGWVIDSATQGPLAGATVQRLGSGGVVLEGVTTDAQGRYTFLHLRRGTHTVQASFTGKAALTQDLDIPNDPAAKLIFALS